MSARWWRQLQGALVVTFGVVVLGMALSGLSNRYLRPGMRWPLAITGVITGVIMAVVGSVGCSGQPVETLGDDHHHDGGAPRVGWLLGIPLVALLLLRPAPLGVDAAGVLPARDARDPRTARLPHCFGSRAGRRSPNQPTRTFTSAPDKGTR